MRLIVCFALLGGAVCYAQSDAITARAITRWTKCAESGSADCQYHLGIAYIEAKPPNPLAGIQWLSKAAGQGEGDAQNRLGRLYYRGQFVTRDYARTRKYWIAAAHNGIAAGQANMGLLYWKGYGLPIDLEEAFAWSELSAVRLKSGAVQRDQILAALSPEQWARARDRATVLAKECRPATTFWKSVFNWLDTVGPVFEGLMLVGMLVLLVWSVVKNQVTALRKRFRRTT
ncbi:MAG: tetratricopeptide repeat protein [Bryobacteraceae bacterium]